MFRSFALFLCFATLHISTFRHANAVLIPRKVGPGFIDSDLRQHHFASNEFTVEAKMRQSSPDPASSGPSPSPSYVITRSDKGFVRSAGVGATITIGITATIQFSITVDGILATDLVRNDEPFRNRLPRESIQSFRLLEEKYRGGLNIPFLEWIGANLNETVTTADLDDAGRTVPLYRRLTFFARRILNNQPVTRVRISGRTSVTGTSFVPRTIFSFIKVATVQLTDGSEVRVISANANDVAFAAFDGTGVLTNATEIQDFAVETLVN